MKKLSISKYLQTWRERVSHYLETVFVEDGPAKTLFQAMNYSLLGGGKRLRPILCLATAHTFGIVEEQVMPAAAALEMIHCYSLIHDDMPEMDNDDLRRGRLTNHKVYGQAQALLAGDGLLTYAFEQMSKPLPVPPTRQLEMIRILASRSGCFGMVAGQAADMNTQGKTGDMDVLSFIHTNKTAKLIQASIEIGGLFAELTDEQAKALSEYGLEIGLAFQIIDDILDVEGDTSVLGKRAGADEDLDKLTYPKLIGLEESKKLARDTVARAVGALQSAKIKAPLLEEIGQFVLDRHN
jgi:geranylgeranyl diphosphate synthase, type II